MYKCNNIVIIFFYMNCEYIVFASIDKLFKKKIDKSVFFKKPFLRNVFKIKQIQKYNKAGTKIYIYLFIYKIKLQLIIELKCGFYCSISAFLP